MREFNLERGVREKEIKEIQEKYMGVNKKIKKKSKLKERLESLMAEYEDRKKLKIELENNSNVRIFKIIRDKSNLSRIKAKKIDGSICASTIGEILQAKGIKLSLGERHNAEEENEENKQEEISS